MVMVRDSSLARSINYDNYHPPLGNTVGQAISEHPDIRKVAFTGSTLTGRKILKAAAESNLKVVTLELGGKNPAIVFDDVNVESVAQQAAIGILYANISSTTVSFYPLIPLL